MEDHLVVETNRRARLLLDMVEFYQDQAMLANMQARMAYEDTVKLMDRALFRSRSRIEASATPRPLTEMAADQVERAMNTMTAHLDVPAPDVAPIIPNVPRLAPEPMTRTAPPVAPASGPARTNAGRAPVRHDPLARPAPTQRGEEALPADPYQRKWQHYLSRTERAAVYHAAETLPSTLAGLEAVRTAAESPGNFIAFGVLKLTLHKIEELIVQRTATEDQTRFKRETHCPLWTYQAMGQQPPRDGNRPSRPPRTASVEEWNAHIERFGAAELGRGPRTNEGEQPLAVNEGLVLACQQAAALVPTPLGKNTRRLQRHVILDAMKALGDYRGYRQYLNNQALTPSTECAIMRYPHMANFEINSFYYHISMCGVTVKYLKKGTHGLYARNYIEDSPAGVAGEVDMAMDQE
jgi:hypothetical protein